jgi:hypothetical protein
MRIILLTIVLAGLMGCASPKTSYVQAPIPKYDPQFPAPYEVCNISFEVIEENNRAMVSITYNDNITAAICDRDKDRYIQQLINLTCFYRKDLNERICNNKELNEQN